MPGKWLTSHQKDVYMVARKKGFSQMTSAAKAGMSERSGREIERSRRIDPRDKKRDWSTRKDPFTDVWDKELVRLLEKKPKLTAITLLEFLQEKYPDSYQDNVLRTLQRRVKKWKALHGPKREVMFLQQHEPGRLGLSDFTQLKKVTITIVGKVFKHLLYHFRLAFSHWSHVKVICGGESYTALAEGLQEALLRLGGTPMEHRTDSLSAAFKNLSKEEKQDTTDRYSAFCEHYGMKATRNNLGAKHENGSVEVAHSHLKKRIRQALLLRGSSDFESLESYQQFIDQVVKKHNKRNAITVESERKALQALPRDKAADYTEISTPVSSSSTIQVRRVTYTVPSRLIGEILRVRLYHDRLICYLGSTHTITLDRVHARKNQRKRSVNYRHVIHSLVRKPQAFRHSKIRDDLLPNSLYCAIWQHVNRTMPDEMACKFIVGLLSLAATENCEQALSEHVLEKINNETPLVLDKIQDRFSTRKATIPQIKVSQHLLAKYNMLIPNHKEKDNVRSTYITLAA